MAVVDPITRFFRYVVVSFQSGCWEWNGAADKRGYGRFAADGKKHLSHKWIYELRRGLVPTGLELDHLCRNPKCVNVEHLEAVTHKENCARGAKPGPPAGEHCQYGHPLMRRVQGGRLRSWCGHCKRIAQLDRRHRNPEKYRELKRKYRNLARSRAGQ